MPPLRRLENLSFDNTFAGLSGDFSTKVSATPFAEPPYLVGFNPQGAVLLDLDPEEARRPEFPQCFGGNLLLPGSDPVAMLYAGHQFGVYVSRLGDGRAILLGEVRNHANEKWDLHLKGAGRTPFSRDGDGRAVLRSTIREYLCSEAMHGLGIPTTRALCIVGSDEKVHRETVETAATLLRLAPSHVRFGTFEVFYYRRQFEYLTRLADYVIEQHWPDLAQAPDKYLRFFADVVHRTASLMGRWQSVGFAHGVMNSDNMSILGLTLDYGPFGFLDDYDPGFICNHSDHHGRYAFDRQPAIGLWNLSCLAQALTPLASPEALKTVLDGYQSMFDEQYLGLMRAKLGLCTACAGDRGLIETLLAALQSGRVDYTWFFRQLSQVSTVSRDGLPRLRDAFDDSSMMDRWLDAYRARLGEESSEDRERARRMNQTNPKYILRNYLAHQAIDLARQKDFAEVDRLLRVLQHPYAEQPEMDRYAAPPPNWGKHLVLSCSS
jgi:uncharacterized protein YdiU (UPF0061 family)